MKRRPVIVYVDGFNLYKGCLQGTGWRWLDLVGLADDLVGSGCTVVAVKYFTARVDDRVDDPLQSQRQDVFLRALTAHCGSRLTITYGRFSTHRVRKRLVRPLPDGTEFVQVYETREKASDVNLGAHLVWDSCHRAMGVAMVVSNDSDLQTPIDMARASGVAVVTVNPQIIDRRAGRIRRQAAHLTGDDTRKLTVGRLRRNQLPETVLTEEGPIRRPPEWAP